MNSFHILPKSRIISLKRQVKNKTVLKKLLEKTYGMTNLLWDNKFKRRYVRNVGSISQKDFTAEQYCLT